MIKQTNFDTEMLFQKELELLGLNNDVVLSKDEERALGYCKEAALTNEEAMEGSKQLAEVFGDDQFRGSE